MTRFLHAACWLGGLAAMTGVACTPQVQQFEVDARITGMSSHEFTLIYFVHDGHTHVLRASPEFAKRWFGRTTRMRFTSEDCQAMKERVPPTYADVSGIKAIEEVE
jgi:hypothetical protein